jgi:hypothetical protein
MMIFFLNLGFLGFILFLKAQMSLPGGTISCWKFGAQKFPVKKKLQNVPFSFFFRKIFLNFWFFSLQMHERPHTPQRPLVGPRASLDESACPDDAVIGAALAARATEIVVERMRALPTAVSAKQASGLEAAVAAHLHAAAAPREGDAPGDAGARVSAEMRVLIAKLDDVAGADASEVLATSSSSSSGPSPDSPSGLPLHLPLHMPGTGYSHPAPMDFSHHQSMVYLDNSQTDIMVDVGSATEHTARLDLAPKAPSSLLARRIAGTAAPRHRAVAVPECAVVALARAGGGGVRTPGSPLG